MVADGNSTLGRLTLPLLWPRRRRRLWLGGLLDEEQATDPIPYTLNLHLASSGGGEPFYRSSVSGAPSSKAGLLEVCRAYVCSQACETVFDQWERGLPRRVT